MTKIREYLKSNGQPSSTRLFSYMILWFFFLSNTIILLLLFLGSGTLDSNTLIFVLTYDFILLLAIFAPKQLAKIQEIKEVIELAKVNGTTNKTTNESEKTLESRGEK